MSDDRFDPALSPEQESAMGVVLSFVDMARQLAPPEDLSGREALEVYARFCDKAAAEFFGEDRWRRFADYCHKHAGWQA